MIKRVDRALINGTIAEDLDPGLYLDTNNVLSIVDNGCRMVWHLYYFTVNTEPLITIDKIILNSNGLKTEIGEIQPSFSEQFLLKAIAVASGKVENIDLNDSKTL